MLTLLLGMYSKDTRERQTDVLFYSMVLQPFIFIKKLLDTRRNISSLEYT
jgi:hypothetical protein